LPGRAGAMAGQTGIAWLVRGRARRRVGGLADRDALRGGERGCDRKRKDRLQRQRVGGGERNGAAEHAAPGGKLSESDGARRNRVASKVCARKMPLRIAA